MKVTVTKDIELEDSRIILEDNVVEVRIKVDGVSKEFKYPVKEEDDIVKTKSKKFYSYWVSKAFADLNATVTEADIEAEIDTELEVSK